MHVRIAFVYWCNPGIALRFSDHCDFEHTRNDKLRRHFRAQSIHALLLKQRGQLVRWTGQQDDDLFLAFIFSRKPLPGRGPIRILQHSCPGNHVCLLRIVCCHFVATRGEATLQAGHDLGIAPQFKLQRISDRFAGEIVLGRPESTHKNNNIGPRKCEACSSGEMLAAVADDSLENHLNSELVEFFGEIKRIRVLAERGQQLRADRDDLGVHALKCK